jgi:sugar phosphate isomerase/epimerase
MTFHPRLGCSSISFRHQDLPMALSTIRDIGFEEIDLGALPGVCNHVPYDLTADAVTEVIGQVEASGITVRSVNGDVGDLNARLDADARAARQEHLNRLLSLTAGVGARALVLPCGAQDHAPVASLEEDLALVAEELTAAAAVARSYGVELWTESLHFFRLSWNLDIASRLHELLADSGVGVVMDFSHIVAAGNDPVDYVNRVAPIVRHVHLRDAVPGNIHLSIGNGAADFASGIAALLDAGYEGNFALELETRDVSHEERPASAAEAGRYISEIISTNSRQKVVVQ